jgi:hypothetical protein
MNKQPLLSGIILLRSNCRFAIGDNPVALSRSIYPSIRIKIKRGSVSLSFFIISEKRIAGNGLAFSIHSLT